MKPPSQDEIEALTNWDGMLCKPPFRNAAQKRQHYARFIDRMLWRTFTTEQWREIGDIIDEMKVHPKLKKTTVFLLQRHVRVGNPNA